MLGGPRECVQLHNRMAINAIENDNFGQDCDKYQNYNRVDDEYLEPNHIYAEVTYEAVK